MEEININEIVKIEQMPKVFSQLEMIGKFIDECVKDIDILPCTEENKNDVKKKRTEINNILKELDDRRKFIKNKILEPYETFNEKYEQECKGKLLSASEILKNKIDTIEEQQKQEKQEELELFAKEYIKVNNLENIMSFDDIPLNITLSASMKSLKEETKRFIEDVANDVELIKLEEYSDEILLEYKKTFDFTKSKLDVLTRHKQLEEIQKQQEERQLQFDEEEKIVEKVEEIVAPKEIIDDEDIITVTFKITDTKENIIKVREYMKKEKINYE